MGKSVLGITPTTQEADTSLTVGLHEKKIEDKSYFSKVKTQTRLLALEPFLLPREVGKHTEEQGPISKRSKMEHKK